MTRTLHLAPFAVLLLLVAAPAPVARAQTGPSARPAGTIAGTVRGAEDGRPIRFANVILLGTRLGAMADTTGQFRMANVPPGSYVLRATFLGYASVETPCVVGEGREATIDFALRCTLPRPDPRYAQLGIEPMRIRSDSRPPLAPTPVVSDEFTARLHQELARHGGNSIHSPLCVAASCGLLLRGARGETAGEIIAVLHAQEGAPRFLSTLDTLRAYLDVITFTTGGQWRLANGAWFDGKLRLREGFMESARSIPADTVAAIDFSGAPEQGRNAINRWARDGTRGRIPELIPVGSIDVSTALVLANTVFFRSRWLHPFAEGLTADETFWVGQTDSTKVPTMQSTMETLYGETDDEQVVRLDYRGGNIGMMIVLPRARDGLTDLERRLDAHAIAAVRGCAGPSRVELHLPRWRAASEWDLVPVLQDIGISRAFRPGECDLLGAIEDPMAAGQLHVSGAFHAAAVDAYEEGTEASAATAHIATGSTMEWEEPVVVRVDHPFLWWIQENTTGTILFMGRVVDP